MLTRLVLILGAYVHVLHFCPQMAFLISNGDNYGVSYKITDRGLNYPPCFGFSLFLVITVLNVTLKLTKHDSRRDNGSDEVPFFILSKTFL